MNNQPGLSYELLGFTVSLGSLCWPLYMCRLSCSRMHVTLSSLILCVCICKHFVRVCVCVWCMCVCASVCVCVCDVSGWCAVCVLCAVCVVCCVSSVGHLQSTVWSCSSGLAQCHLQCQERWLAAPHATTLYSTTSSSLPSEPLNPPLVHT